MAGQRHSRGLAWVVEGLVCEGSRVRIRREPPLLMVSVSNEMLEIAKKLSGLMSNSEARKPTVRKEHYLGHGGINGMDFRIDTQTIFVIGGTQGKVMVPVMRHCTINVTRLPSLLVTLTTGLLFQKILRTR